MGSRVVHLGVAAVYSFWADHESIVNWYTLARFPDRFQTRRGDAGQTGENAFSLLSPRLRVFAVKPAPDACFTD